MSFIVVILIKFFTIRNHIVKVVLMKLGKNHIDNCQKLVQKNVGMIKNTDQNQALKKEFINN